MLDYFNDDACLVGVRIYFRNYGYHGTFIYIKHPMMMMICDFLKTSDVKLERHPRPIQHARAAIPKAQPPMALSIARTSRSQPRAAIHIILGLNPIC